MLSGKLHLVVFSLHGRNKAPGRPNSDDADVAKGKVIDPAKKKNPATVALGKKGGAVRAAALTPEKRKAVAKKR